MNNETFDTSSFETYLAEKVISKDMIHRSRSFLDAMLNRRSVRHFSDESVPFEVIENVIRTASSAPSGANKQPWTFCVVADPELKKQIRHAAEKEEYINYNSRMSDEWKADLKSFGTDWNKPFLTVAPYLIVVFKQTYELRDDIKRNNYYVSESVGIACGLLLAAIHNAGLVALTHTPSPMNFLRELLQRPENEKPFLLIPVGYPAANCTVPVLQKKRFDEIAQLYL